MSTPDSIEIFAGIDVSQAYVDVCALDAAGKLLWTARVVRTAAALDKLAKRLGPHASAVLEATGGLEKLPAAVLEAAGVAVTIENPARMRHYALSRGLLEKSDTIDARMLAEYARERRPRARRRPDPQREAVASLVTRRSQLVRLRAGERTRLRRETDPFCKKSIGKVIDILNQQIDKCEQQIDQRLRASETLSAHARLLCSAPGVGQRIASSLVAWLPELGSLNRGEIAKLVGVAPLLKQSGQWKGHVMIRGGRLRVRSLLYLAALSAVRRNAYYHDFYLRLLTKGKVKKVALIAVARKLLLALNRMLATSSPWDNSFQRA